MGGYNIYIYFSRGDVGWITDIHVDQGACFRGGGENHTDQGGGGRKGSEEIVSY